MMMTVPRTIIGMPHTSYGYWARKPLPDPKENAIRLAKTRRMPRIPVL